MCTNPGVLRGLVGRKVENDILPIAPPFGDQTHAIGKLHLPVSSWPRAVLNDYRSHRKGMTVRENEPHSIFVAQAKEIFKYPSRFMMSPAHPMQDGCMRYSSYGVKDIAVEPESG